jgi:hypothetical protein
MQIGIVWMMDLNPQVVVFTLGVATISWGSKKQTGITHSTIESGLLALGAVGKEVEWLKNLLIDLPIWPSRMPPISLHCYSQATLLRVCSKS